MVKKPDFSFFNSVNSTLTFLFGVLILTCCNPPEELSTIPRIFFDENPLIDNIKLVPVESGPDSLIISFNFEDGDGNLGLESSTNSDEFLSNDVFFPYHDLEAIRDSEGKFVTFRSESTLFPWFATFPISTNSALYGSVDNRPDFSCIDYEVGYLNPERTFFTSDERIFDEDNQSQIKFYTSLSGSFSIDTDLLVKDTVFIRRNENRFNILVDYYIKRNGQYEFFDWLTAFDETACLGTDYNGRFPILDEGNLNSRSAIEGTLRYAMLSSGFNIIFRNDTLQLRVSIKDRALNTSNQIATPDFTLQGIRVD